MSLEQSHHIPIGMYSGCPAVRSRCYSGWPHLYITIGLWWSNSNETRFKSLVKMSPRNPPWWASKTAVILAVKLYLNLNINRQSGYFLLANLLLETALKLFPQVCPIHIRDWSRGRPEGPWPTHLEQVALDSCQNNALSWQKLYNYESWWWIWEQFPSIHLRGKWGAQRTRTALCHTHIPLAAYTQ